SLYALALHRHLHSFPTRRSSDLAADPVSALEKQRNEVIVGAQGNRNPFIDNPHLATRIWGGDEADNRWDGEAEEADTQAPTVPRSEEHTSELQSRENLVCRLLLE